MATSSLGAIRIAECEIVATGPRAARFGLESADRHIRPRGNRCHRGAAARIGICQAGWARAVFFSVPIPDIRSRAGREKYKDRERMPKKPVRKRVTSSATAKAQLPEAARP